MTATVKKLISIILTVTFVLSVLPPIDIFAATYTFSGGAGTASNPYLIATPQDLSNVRNDTGKSYLQICDISMKNFSFEPILSFSGTYNGGGYVISDLTITVSGSYIGLFGTNSGILKNINLVSCNIDSSIPSSNMFCGGIVGRNYSSGKIIDCSVSGTVSGTTYAANKEEYVGGIVGLSQGTIENCKNSADVIADSTGASDLYAGGIVGNNNANVINCFNEGNIKAINGRNCLAAGIAAINFEVIKGVKNTGEIYALSTRTYDGYNSDSYAAGIAGYNKGTVSYGENSGLITAESTSDCAEAGGIAAYTGGSYSEAGGFIVEYSKNTGDVTSHSTAGESRSGGITGTCYKDCYVRYCCNTGNVSATENKQYSLAIAGGVAGSLMYGTMMQSCNHGDVTVSATQYDAIACGVANTTDAVMIDCYNTGNVFADSTPVRYSYGTGAALFADSDTTCVNCYNVGKVSAKYSSNRRYGLYALNGGADRNAVKNCFTTDTANTKVSERMTLEQAKKAETYAGYNFENIWAIDPTINDGLPYLRNIPDESANGWYVDPKAIVRVTGIELSTTPFYHELGESFKLEANVIPKNATNQKIIWTTRDSNIATVDQNGVVTTVGFGLTYIYAKTDDGSYQVSRVIQINKKTPTFSGGSGTSSDPYIITTAEQLQNVMYSPTSYYRQAANISLEGVDFIPIGTKAVPFSGNYDGDGFAISDVELTADGNRTYLGLFGYSLGTVSNVKMNNVTVNSSSATGDIYAAALVAYNKGSIKNCHVNAKVNAITRGEGLDVYAGGITAYSTSYISKLSFSGSVTAEVSYIDCIAYAGGIAGYGYSANGCQNYGDILALGTVSCDTYAGGIHAYAEGTMSSCYNNGKISTDGGKFAAVGGITGCNESTVMNCKNDGDLNAATDFTDGLEDTYTYAGGITGSNYATVMKCYNNGFIHSTSDATYAYAGGIVGYNQSNATIKNCNNYGEVKAGSYGAESRAGGIASTTYRDSTIKYCCNNGDVSIYNNAIYNSGSAGGVVAVLQYGSVFECCNHGTVTIDSKDYEPYGCGIAGFTDSTLMNCYSDGNVHSNFAYLKSYSPGMICGIGDGCGTPVTNCYFAGALTSKYSYTERYGLIWTNGQGGNSLTNCYTINLYSSKETASKMTAEASKLQATYAGYDFTNVWGIDPSINEGRPYLRKVLAENPATWYTGSEEQPSLNGHSESDWIVDVLPTCGSAGSRHTECTECGKIIKSELIYDADAHSFDEWTVYSEATCIDAGEERRTCQICFYYESRVIDIIGHIYEISSVEPTCTKQGYIQHTCSVCGDDYRDGYVDALGHSYGEWDETVEPTCTEKGTEIRECGRCKDQENREIAALGHDLVHHDAKAPTCTEIGWNAYDTCQRCDYTTYEELEANGHNYESVITAPTCTEKGYTTYKCTSCSDSYIDSYTNPTGHSYGEWGATKKPTCTEKGEEVRTCHCGHSENREILALGHDLVHHDAKAPTCTEIGWSAYDICQRCDYTTYEELEANGHNYESVITDPTCTEKGYTTHKCASCGDSYIDSYTDPTGHSYDEWYVVLEAVCEFDGQNRRDCINCDHYEVEIVPKIGHDLIYHDAKAPTCTEIGWKAYETCSRCDYYTFEELPETGHSYSAVVTEPTCTEKGYTTYTCHCGDSYVDNYVDALGHNYESVITPPTEAEQGYTTHTCTRCGDSYVDSYTAPLYRRGDLNRDGTIDVDDVLLCLDLAFVAPTEEQLKLADLDASGTIDVDDILICLDLCFAD